MPVRKALILYGVMALLYVAALVILDQRRGFSHYIPQALSQLPVVIALALASFAVRFVRWMLLCRWQGSTCQAGRGCLAYLSGFALTATPGKVGELIRIRYFSRLGVPPHLTFSAFVFERALDLVVVFLLACFSISDPQLFYIALTFVLLFLLLVASLIAYPNVLTFCASECDDRGLLKFRGILQFLAVSMAGCRIWLKPVPIVSSLALGFLAWSLTALAFVYLLNSLNIVVPSLVAFAIYPTAMLAGAASMVPGGVGSTEIAITAQLGMFGVPLDAALLAAVVVRIGTLWLSILCGLIAILLQELQVSSRSDSLLQPE